jgi:hypothetical protein
MFPDAPQLFVSDGVHPDLVRAGQPRLWSRSSRRRSRAAPQTVPAQARQPLMSVAFRPTAA